MCVIPTNYKKKTAEQSGLPAVDGKSVPFEVTIGKHIVKERLTSELAPQQRKYQPIKQKKSRGSGSQEFTGRRQTV